MLKLKNELKSYLLIKNLFLLNFLNTTIKKEYNKSLCDKLIIIIFFCWKKNTKIKVCLDWSKCIYV